MRWRRFRPIRTRYTERFMLCQLDPFECAWNASTYGTIRAFSSRRNTIRVADLPSFRSVFLTNSLGVAPVRQVDEQILFIDPGFTRDVVDAYESVPWDQI